MNQNNQYEILIYLLKSLLCQVVALGIAYLTWFLISEPYLAVVAYILSAFFLAQNLLLPVIWVVFNTILAPGALSVLFFELPQELLGALALFTLITYLPTIWTRVPYYPTAKPVYDEILKLIPYGPQSFLDIGCGNGKLLRYLSSRRPECIFYGIELSPLPYFTARLRSLFSKGKIRILYGSFWKLDLSQYQIVYAFLSPTPMKQVWMKVQNEMKPGTLFISNSFQAPSPASFEIQVSGAHGQRLYGYSIQAENK